jgi:hypothetical protein
MWKTNRRRTGISNLDLDHTALEGLSIQLQGLPEAIGSSEFDVAETLGAHHFAVLNDSDAGHLAAFEKLGNGFVGGIVREVAEMSSIRRLVGEPLWNGLADRIA